MYNAIGLYALYFIYNTTIYIYLKSIFKPEKRTCIILSFVANLSSQPPFSLGGRKRIIDIKNHPPLAR